MIAPEMKFYDRDGDLVVFEEEVPDFHREPGEYPSNENLVLCLASDHDYIESRAGYFNYINRNRIQSIAREELPLYLGRKYKSKKFMEMFR